MKTLRARIDRAAQAAQAGLVVNALLSVVKLIAGIVGHSYALVADAVESTADVVSSAIVWSGLRISAKDADDQFPFGYGKAESLAAVVVGLMLLGAATGIAIQAAREILVPHHAPAPFTLVVLVLTVVIKEWLHRRVRRAGHEVDSLAVQADAWHHRSDALTSAAAAVGITVALMGGEAWAVADDWAALVASGVIAWNGARVLRPAVGDLMDRTPSSDVVDRIRETAQRVPGVKGIETIKVRRSGLSLYVDLHVEADPLLTLREAHVLSGMVKSAIRTEFVQVLGVLVHMEPFEPGETPDEKGSVDQPSASPKNL